MSETRPFTAEDADDFRRLYRDCLDHYKIPRATAAQETRVLEILASGRHMSCLMAYKGSQPLGFATWALTFPAGNGVALYMKELFVTPHARGHGAGRALLAGLVQTAMDERCVRIDWQTDSRNTLSQAFYARINAPAFEKQTYRVTEHDFPRFLKSLG